VFDNDTHPTDAAERRAHFRSILKLGARREFAVGARPVRIGRDCWLGFGAAVMKGVTLGEEVIVAAGAMVVSDVAPRTVVAGNPARPVRALGEEPKRSGLGVLRRGR
jgi:acetyltransferase-like isoleucine patch superfamily enzyme